MSQTTVDSCDLAPSHQQSVESGSVALSIIVSVTNSIKQVTDGNYSVHTAVWSGSTVSFVSKADTGWLVCRRLQVLAVIRRSASGKRLLNAMKWIFRVSYHRWQA